MYPAYPSSKRVSLVPRLHHVLPITSHPHRLPTPRLQTPDFFSTTTPHRVSPSPGTHFPPACTDVHFFPIFNASHPHQSSTVCVSNPPPRGIGVPPMNPSRREAPKSTRSLSNPISQSRARPRFIPNPSREPASSSQFPSSRALSSALPAVRYFRGVRSAKSELEHPTPNTSPHEQIR